jgi:Domain of unknown function (DUF6438)
MKRPMRVWLTIAGFSLAACSAHEARGPADAPATVPAVAPTPSTPPPTVAAPPLPAETIPSIPPLPDPEHIIATLKQGWCEKDCPIYAIDLYDDGTVVWHGRLHVQSIGERRGMLAATKVAQVKKAFRDAGFLKLQQPQYKEDAKCARSPVTTLAFSQGDERNEIENDHCQSAPKLLALEKQIATLLGVDAWVLANPPAPGGPLPSGEHLLLTLERTICFGDCPIYALHVYDDGVVVWNGKSHVVATGERRTTVDKATVDALVKAFADAQFFDRDSSGKLRPPPCKEENGMHCPVYGFTSGCTDTSHAITTYQRSGRSQTLDNGHCKDGNPISELERKIDELVGTKRWIR